MQNLNKVFFLAAGLGTRLKPYTDQVAKPAIPFWGLPQFLYPYFFAKDLNVSKWAYNTHHLPETLKSTLKSYGLNDGTEFFEPQLLDSAGGIYNASKFLQDEEHFLVINADSLFVYSSIQPFQAAMSEHIKTGRLATLFTVRKEGAGSTFSGLWSDSSGQLIKAGINSEKDHQKSKASHFIGVTVFSKKIFSYLKPHPQNIIHDILVPLAASEQIRVQTMDDVDWFELGKTQDYIKNHHVVSEHLKTGRYSEHSFSSFIRTQKFFDPQWSFDSFSPRGLEFEILKHSL